MPDGETIHFMGAGGIGVSALAILAKHAGATVTACDRGANEITALLAGRGIPVAVGHSPAHVADADLLVHTSAVPADHPEIAGAKRCETRGRFLARLMAGGQAAWGIAGTHGKTTTSWLLSAIAIEAGLDPTVFVGGLVPQLEGMNYRLGTGPFIAELDESDGSFLLPRLDVAVVTNIEPDHMTHYLTLEALAAAFSRYAGGVEKSGLLVAGIEYPLGKAVYDRHLGRKISVSLREDVPADVTARKVRYAGEATRFEAVHAGKSLGEFSLALPGACNVQNALTALAAALGMGIGPDVARRALEQARGVGRRMERLGMCGGAALYTDYAHHPTEVAAALAALKQRHPGETLAAFQPHLYSRTRDFADEFGAALAAADRILLVDIYPAREDPIPGVTSALLAGAAAARGARVNGPVPVSRAAEEVRRLARGCEAVVMMGAGDIDAEARILAAGEA